VEDKPVAVGRKHEGNIEGDRVVEGLLHGIADAVVIVLGLDQGDGDVGLVVEDVVGALGFPAGDQLAANDDPAFGETHLFADLRHLVPASQFHGGSDVLGTNVALAEVLLVHAALEPSRDRSPNIAKIII
jgi:hypothetical protein